MTLTAETASGFYHFRQAKFSQNVCDRSSPNFRIGSPAGVDDCCKLALRSLKGRCHGNQLLFTRSTDFFVTDSDQCAIQFVRSATTRSTVVGVIHEVDGRRVLLTMHTNTPTTYVDICLESICLAKKTGPQTRGHNFVKS